VNGSPLFDREGKHIGNLELDALASHKGLCNEEMAFAKLSALKSITDRTMQDVRRFSHELHPAILDHLGLVPALEQMVDEIE
jgi:signal transduction histidine kinase